MKRTLVFALLLILGINFGSTVFADVHQYYFIGAVGTYTEITGGTVLGDNTNDNENFNAIDLGFTFTYNDVEYTQVSVQTNGFLAMGSEVVTSNLAISAATGTNNVVAAMNRDLKSRDNGELMYLLSGTAPNRVFTVQWKNYRRSPNSCANDVLNFQIQLHENGNKVVFAYGDITAMTVSTAQSVQVGLRGDSNQDFNNRSTTEDWTATTAGTVNNAYCRINADVYPTEGLTFTFAPLAPETPPSPAVNPIPADNATNIAITTKLSWQAGNGIIDGYKLYFGTNTPPTNLVNGTIVYDTVYEHPELLSYGIPHYWRVVPFNTQGGDAADCPIWKFTTLPTVNTFPYEQNFDDVTAPALPLGWSAIDANNDGYIWETYDRNADTTPNAARIRYSTLPMDDWLLSPPLDLDAETTYLIKFSYCAGSAAFPEALSVYTGTAPNAAALTNLIFTNTNITNTLYEQVQVFFTPNASGLHIIGFHGHSEANMLYLYVDSFSIMEKEQHGVTPVVLSSFTAAVTTHNEVKLDWVTQSEHNQLGYRVYRSESSSQNDALLITPVLIPATNTSVEHSYHHVDSEVENAHNYYYWLESVDPAASQFFGPVSVTVSFDVPPVLPEISSLKNAYPNPFKLGTGTNIEIDIKAGETGTLSIYNIQGQVVKTVSLAEGSHKLVWNGRDSKGKVCGSGIFFYKLSSPSLNQTKKMILMK